MIRIEGLDHVAINCRDLNRSMDFYVQVLGLKVTKREYSKPGTEYFLDCGTSLVGLIQGSPTDRRRQPHEEGVGFSHAAFRVRWQDFDRIAEELKGRDITIHKIAKRKKSWSMYFSDPDGNKLEITAWPGEG